jgi:tetratricopeptide (TPR) repeat protein
MSEAEVYYSMGLVKEAIEAYQAILSSGLSLDLQTKAKIERRIEELTQKAAVDEDSEEDSEIEISEDLTLTTEALASEGNVQAILDGAFALRELGLYDEAVNEYVKLFRVEYPTDKIVSEICRCLLRIAPPAKVKDDVSRIIEEYAPDERSKALGKFRLGLEMEKINRPQYAMGLYQEAAALAPDDTRIRERINYLTAKYGPQKKVQKSKAQGLQETKDRRRWERLNVRIPEFLFVEFEIDRGDGQPKPFRLKVTNYSKYGLGFLVPAEQRELLKMIRPGDKLKDVIFYAKWAIIKVDALVRHITELDSGPHKGEHVIGVESDEVIESSVGL